MFKSFKGTKTKAGVLSFLLPGLGHVYLGFNIRGILVFMAFILPMGFAGLRWLVPLIALFAAWEAFRLGSDAGNNVQTGFTGGTWGSSLFSGSSLRLGAFSLAGIVAFLCWFFSLVSWHGPLETQVLINQQVETIASAVRKCAKAKGQYPSSIEECSIGFSDSTKISDPWGYSFIFSIGDRDFEIHSMGPDGKQGTEDDFHYRFRK